MRKVERFILIYFRNRFCGIVPFTYTFLQSSCGCNDVINGKYDKYEIMVTRNH